MDEHDLSEPLLEPSDGPFLVGLGNWVAESLDVLELSNEQVLLLYMLLNRATDALWRNYRYLLLELYKGVLSDDDDDDE